ncbi:proton-coupled zinc antiporter SLC30A9, mitochondrial-like [Corticium candelabrum]|uniref:proton-coupled zinc antiporter SLC30A9, mitochondrial-like n=1 Tax=Corticium candelabrum TaxID=121492 RepID=UPI002E254C16|nr:proton-coupled zinc antiporter SLC30A9, mitochondrial-like [Corticium candelabrum]
MSILLRRYLLTVLGSRNAARIARLRRSKCCCGHSVLLRKSVVVSSLCPRLLTRVLCTGSTGDSLGEREGSSKTDRRGRTYTYQGNTYISATRALNDYLLDFSDLDNLTQYAVRDAYGDAERPVELMYRLQDVRQKAFQVWGSKEALENEAKQRQLETEEDEKRRKQLGALIGYLKKSVKDKTRQAVDHEAFGAREDRVSFLHGSARIVMYAIVSNATVMLFKVVAWLYTGSSSMLSESIHSFVDTANQALLAFGIAQSIRRPDPDHPYGFSRAQYVYALISGMGVFFLGAGVSLYHGVTSLLHPPTLQSLPVALTVLGGSLLVETGVLLSAFSHIRRSAFDSKVSFREYVIRGRDPSAVAVLMEDSAAVLGVFLAASCLGLTYVFNNPVYDAIGSICIGTLLGTVALFLVRRNGELLVGRTIDAHKLRQIIEIIEDDVMVRSIHDVKAVDLGANTLRFKAEVNFDGREVARAHVSRLDLEPLLREVSQLTTVGEFEQFLLHHGEQVVDVLAIEVDRIEKNIKKANPDCRHVDLEIL